MELIATDEYLYLVEMVIEVDETVPLQAFYENQAADIIDYVLENTMQKSRAIPGPTPTPLSSNQQEVNDYLGRLLIEDLEAGEGWEAIYDNVSEGYVQICRIFELRVNADVYWVGFTNCIFDPPEGFEIEDVAGFYSDDSIILESAHSYEGDFVIYGFSTGHIYYEAWLYQDDLLYLVSLESRSLVGTTVESGFGENVDDFLYNMLMVNVEKNK
jgi:hypothetical protein